jgi:hypothetical protein
MLEQYYRIKKVTGININCEPDGSITIAVCHVQVDKNKLEFVKKIGTLVQVSDVRNHVPEGALVAVNMTGKGVLIKILHNTEVINQENFSTVLPNGRFDDFYIQQFVSGGLSFIALIRRVVADKELEALRREGMQPLLLSLGPFVVQQISGQLNNYGEAFIFDGHTIERNESKQWLNYSFTIGAKSSYTLKADSEALEDNIILPYAAAFQLLLSDRLERISVQAPRLIEKLDDYLKFARLKVNGISVLFVFFFLLMVNYLALSLLSTANEVLLQKVSVTERSTIDAANLNEQIGKKELLLKDLGWEGFANKAVYIDQMAQLLPERVSWSSLNIDPVDAAFSKSQRTTRFQTRKIRISGISPDILPVNEWLARIKTKNWVKGVHMESYTYNNELKTGLFTVLIDY